jgi:hypothetical protein
MLEEKENPYLDDTLNFVLKNGIELIYVMRRERIQRCPTKRFGQLHRIDFLITDLKIIKDTL